jgi:phage gp29-like protein
MVANIIPLERPEGRRPPPAVQSWADVVDDRWTVARVRAALTEHVNGLFGSSALLVDAMLADDRIAADTRTRVLAVTGLPFRLEPSTKGDRRRSKAVAKDCEALWPSIAPASLLHDLLRWAILLGFAPAVCGWTTTARRWTPSAVLFHPQHVDLDTVAGSLRASTVAGLVPVVPGDGAWVLHAPDGARPWMGGAVRGLALPWLARQYARRDWSRFTEKHGLPIVGAIVPMESDKADKDQFYSDLRRLGSEGLVMLPRDREDRGFDLKYLEPGNVQASGSFKELIAHCDRAIAVALLGQANSADEGGSYAKATALDAIRLDLLESDARSLGETIYAQLLRPWAHYQYGDADLAPVPVWDPTPPTDTSALATTHKTAGEALAVWATAAASAGFTVDVEAMATRYGVPLKRAPEPPPAPDAAEDTDDKPPADALAALAAPAALAVGQTFVDSVVARGTASGSRAMRGTLGAIAAAIEAADSPEALRAGLLGVLGAADPAALASALARAQTLAAMAGRYDVLDDL